MKIHTLDLHFLNHEDTIAAFLIDVGNKKLALVETGPHSTFPKLKAAITAAGYDINDVSDVFLTHIHFDHAGAAWALADLGATIHVHPAGEKHLENPTKLYNSAKMIYGDKMEYLWGKMNPIATERLRASAHGETISVGNAQFQAWHTPGHASHHIAWQLGDVLFAGDAAGVKIGNGIVVPPCPPPDIDIELWQNSIKLMKNLNVKKIMLTHFGKVENVEKQLDDLETILLEWKNWIKPYFDAGEAAEIITPKFEKYVANTLNKNGITGEMEARYASANPAWMSVAGLLRYWKKQAKN